MTTVVELKKSAGGKEKSAGRFHSHQHLYNVKTHNFLFTAKKTERRKVKKITVFIRYLQQSPLHLIPLVLVSDLVLIHQVLILVQFPCLDRHPKFSVLQEQQIYIYMYIHTYTHTYMCVFALFDVVNESYRS